MSVYSGKDRAIPHERRAMVGSRTERSNVRSTTTVDRSISLTFHPKYLRFSDAPEKNFNAFAHFPFATWCKPNVDKAGVTRHHGDVRPGRGRTTAIGSNIIDDQWPGTRVHIPEFVDVFISADHRSEVMGNISHPTRLTHDGSIDTGKKEYPEK